MEYHSRNEREQTMHFVRFLTALFIKMVQSEFRDQFGNHKREASHEMYMINYQGQRIGDFSYRMLSQHILYEEITDG